MLRKWWRLVWGEPEPDTTLALLQILVDNQERGQQAMLSAVSGITLVAEKQAEVLGQYLKLFNTPGEPRQWERNIEEENTQELVSKGFPIKGSEVEQAEWVLDHLESVEDAN